VTGGWVPLMFCQALHCEGIITNLVCSLACVYI